MRANLVARPGIVPDLSRGEAMERDKRLALELLTDIHDLEGINGVDERNLESNRERDSFSDADIYHLNLLLGGGFISAETQEITGIHTYRLTWSGHDLIERLQKEFFKV